MAVHTDAPPDVKTPPSLTSLADRSTPPMAPRPERVRAYTSLWRMRRYLAPDASKWLVIIGATILGQSAMLAVPLLLKQIIDGPITRGDQRGMIIWGIVALVVGGSEAVFWFVRRYLVGVAALNTETEIRRDMYARMQRLGMRFHSKWPGGQLLSRIMNDLSLVRRFFGFGLIFLVVNILTIIAVIVMMLFLYWPLGIVVVLATIPYAWVVYRNERKFEVIARDVQDRTGDVATSVEEMAHGIRVVKAFGRQDYVYERFNERATGLKNRWMDRVNLSAFFWTLLEAIPSVTLVIVLGMGAYAVKSGLSIGTLSAFVLLMPQLAWPMASLGFLISMLQETMTGADRILEVFDSEPEIKDGTQTLAHAVGHVRFENVGFQFHDADEELLHQVNLDVPPGQTLAVVGATGSGKTVLTALVPRLFDVTSGRITIDGVDIRDLTLDSLRGVVATAFEDPTLFSMSVRENLTLGRPEATEEQIAQALDIAQAGFVFDLPWGLDTRIGEQGMSLSGGQRQRLALARAVLTQPKVLVLDDTLSALDMATEKLVEEALQHVLADVTGIIVAHRASTVMLADQVALIQDGTVTHVGTHASLLATVPAYRYLLSAEDELDPAHERGGASPTREEWDRAAEQLASADLRQHDHEEHEDKR